MEQQNHFDEGASEQEVRIVCEFGRSTPSTQEPLVWLVHVISPSTCDEKRFQKLVEDFVELNTGVICCPSAAISMRQILPDPRFPEHNLIVELSKRSEL